MTADIPNSQKATSTDVSAFRNTFAKRARYTAHDDDGEPGMGKGSSSPEEDGDLFILSVHLGYRLAISNGIPNGDIENGGVED